MLRRLGIIIAAVLLATATMGQDGCDTGTGGDGGKKQQRKGLLGATGPDGPDGGGGGSGGSGGYGGGDSGYGGGGNTGYGDGGDTGYGGGGGGGCDPNYSGCVPTYPPDVDCDDVGQTVDVYGSDPHGLDADSDGSGCE